MVLLNLARNVKIHDQDTVREAKPCGSSDEPGALVEEPLRSFVYYIEQ